MSDLQTALTAHHHAVETFLTAARTIPAAQWKQPRAPGKWSPAEIAEHLAIAYEVNRGILQGAVPGAAAPRFLRPLIRIFLLRPVLQRGRFIPGSRSPKVFRPTGSLVTQDVLLARLQAAAQAFDKYAAGANAPALDHPFFGRLPLVDFVRLQEIHTQHHGRQLPTTVSPRAANAPAMGT